jgi:hypothetical protein
MCDIANVCVFVRAKDLEITGYETANRSTMTMLLSEAANN